MIICIKDLFSETFFNFKDFKSLSDSNKELTISFQTDTIFLINTFLDQIIEQKVKYNDKLKILYEHYNSDLFYYLFDIIINKRIIGNIKWSFLEQIKNNKKIIIIDMNMYLQYFIFDENILNNIIGKNEKEQNEYEKKQEDQKIKEELLLKEKADKLLLEKLQQQEKTNKQLEEKIKLKQIEFNDLIKLTGAVDVKTLIHFEERIKKIENIILNIK